jgi:hypothetical protein
MGAVNDRARGDTHHPLAPEWKQTHEKEGKTMSKANNIVTAAVNKPGRLMNGQRLKRSIPALSIGLIAGSILVAGCSTPLKTREVSTTGFLKNYEQLQPGVGAEAQLRYISPTADFSKYNKIHFEPITVWTQNDSDLEKLPQDEIQVVVNYLDATVRKNLKSDYTFVDKPGPDVMHLRIAITEGRKAKVVRNTMSSIIPIGLVYDLVKWGFTGMHTSVGKADIEMELTDSVSDERLVAAVAARAGRKSLVSGNFSGWGDVQDAFDFWAAQFDTRLTELRAR